jgi:hypothetical protein
MNIVDSNLVDVLIFTSNPYKFGHYETAWMKNQADFRPAVSRWTADGYGHSKAFPIGIKERV